VTAAFALVLALNWRAWLLALMSIAGGGWYWILVGFVHRPRPTTDQVIRITEHPGSSSFPSGHVIFITVSAALVMLAVGHRHLPRLGQWLGWAVTCSVVLLAAISRVYVGAHWPTDVLASTLIAAGWLSLVISVRRISDPAFRHEAPAYRRRWRQLVP
jgi:undecaprenyl-diphosphatase